MFMRNTLQVHLDMTSCILGEGDQAYIYIAKLVIRYTKNVSKH